MFIKESEGYLLFVGVLVDKIDLIKNIFAFLARDIIKINPENRYECIWRSFHKHLCAINLLTEYLYIAEDFEEYDVYEFIEFFYNTEVEKSKSFDYAKNYNLIYRIPDYEESYGKYLNIVRERVQMIAIYASLQKNFALFSSGLKLPNNIFSRDSNLLLDLYNIFTNANGKRQIAEIGYVIKRWYEKMYVDNMTDDQDKLDVRFCCQMSGLLIFKSFSSAHRFTKSIADLGALWL